MEKILVLGTVGREKIHSMGAVSPVVFGGTAFYATEAILMAGGADPLLVSVLGRDLTPLELIGQFSRQISTAGLQQYTDLPSFYWEARYEHSFEESATLVLENRLIDKFRPDWAALRRRFAQIDFCYLAAFDPGVQSGCCDHFADAFIVSETLEYWIDRDREGVLGVTGRSNGLVVTEREFRRLWRFDAPPRTRHRKIVHVIEELDLDFLVVTFADRGSQVSDRRGTFFVPAVNCATVDSTGAGNVFSGGMVAHLAQGGTYDRRRLPDAVAFGTVLAGMQVQDFGNRALRTASAADISMLWQEVKDSISWFDGDVEDWRPTGRLA
jgi:sugar/nucleoside kinase (ribokinase family)